MSRWIFLDVGNILLDEDPLAYHVFRRHWDAVREVCPDLTFLQLLAERERYSARGSRWPLYDAISSRLDDARCAEVWQTVEDEVRGQFEELSPVVTGAADLVERLGEEFRLGLIANQGAECREYLGRLGFLDRFDVVVLSEEVGLHKPDLELYRRAVNAAGVPPGHCTMIGDRLDNDIEPAAALGMETVWVRWTRRAEKGWRPASPDAIAFRDSLERSAALARTTRPEVVPDLIIDRVADLDGSRLVRFGG